MASAFVALLIDAAFFTVWYFLVRQVGQWTALPTNDAALTWIDMTSYWAFQTVFALTTFAPIGFDAYAQVRILLVRAAKTDRLRAEGILGGLRDERQW